MLVNVETVTEIAKLTRIRVERQQREKLAVDLSGILQWVEQLDEIDTTDVPPMTSVANVLTLPTRADAVTQGDIKEDILLNAPAQERGFFTVPKVVE